DEGAGNAGCRCTRSLVCGKCAKESTRDHDRYNRTHAGIPCAMFDDLYRALLGVPGVLVTVASRGACPLMLDTSIGVSGPRGFVERFPRASSCAPSASIATRLTFRDDRP